MRRDCPSSLCRIVQWVKKSRAVPLYLSPVTFPNISTRRRTEPLSACAFFSMRWRNSARYTSFFLCHPGSQSTRRQPPDISKTSHPRGDWTFGCPYAIEPNAPILNHCRPAFCKVRLVSTAVARSSLRGSRPPCAKIRGRSSYTA